MVGCCIHCGIGCCSIGIVALDACVLKLALETVDPRSCIFCDTGGILGSVFSDTLLLLLFELLAPGVGCCAKVIESGPKSSDSIAARGEAGTLGGDARVSLMAVAAEAASMAMAAEAASAALAAAKIPKSADTAV